MNDLQLVPFVPVNDGWILSDTFLADVFSEVGRSRLLETVFWDGSISTAEGFVSMCKKPSNVVTFVFKGQECVGYAWLTGLIANHAFGHFCFFPPVWGDTERIGKMFVDYWFSFEGSNGPLLDTILGAVPGFNKRAHHYVERIGFQRLGVVPRMFKNKQGDRDDAVIFFKGREDAE